MNDISPDEDLKLARPEYSMTDAELLEFVNEAPRYASIATLRKDGSPIVDGVGIEWDGECVYVSIRNTRALRQRLSKDPRACFHIMNSAYPVKWVRFEGVVEVIEDPGYERTIRIMRRYMDKSSEAQELDNFDVDEYANAYTSRGRTMYRLRPHRIHSHDANKQAAVFDLETGKTLDAD